MVCVPHTHVRRCWQRSWSPPATSTTRSTRSASHLQLPLLLCLTFRQNRYMDENRQDSVDIHPRRFEPGICARNYVEDAQQGDSQQQQQEQQQLQQLEEEAWDEE